MAEFAAPGTPDSGHSGDLGGIREHDRFLPIANIGRIMRKAIPENGKISKDAKESIQECVSEFISFVTSEASDKCQREKRKTINGDDLLWAMGTLGFEDYVEPLKLYLQLYREMEGDSKGSRPADQSGKKEGVINGDPGASLYIFLEGQVFSRKMVMC
ncbi:LOW QUALITY PROTEIN: nuclear transcription factor Y subunit B-4-like [Ananas comosus]|uniref:LOW QUALITY PROTEIN: nuclear transcription factor Y subunit B-4-like n=1 Tax=Ananas comosus TaxID=4615 RepID=A0A6P5FQY8_ANACO|nr:LOW QUALITY PROTEIN: nuclear transcription factor Y subunit B-4-like [Ananas comosus]